MCLTSGSVPGDLICGQQFRIWSKEPDTLLMMSDEEGTEEDKKMSMELSRLRKKRSANVNVLKGLFVKMEKILLQPSENRQDDLKVMRALLQTAKLKEQTIRDVGDRILDILPEHEIEKFVEDVTLNEVSFAEKFSVSEGFMAGTTDTDEKLESSKHKDNRKGPRVPELVVKKFNGEPTAWQEFHDTFRAVVDENRKLTDVEKFSYLRGYLIGEASRCIAGLSLTGANYAAAKELLEGRYGNKQLVVASHMKKILKLEAVTSCKSIKPLRNLYDLVRGHVRSLSSIGVESKEYGPMLIPTITEKLPDVIQLEISRRLGTNNWNVDQFLDILSTEISARESCAFVKKSDREEDNRREGNGSGSYPLTTEALLAAGTPRRLVCAFCQGDHFHDKCTTVTELQKRRDIVTQNKLCFRCLNSHLIRNCKSKRSCYTCKSKRHHTAICDGPVEQIQQTLVNARSSVMLQTASGQVSDNSERKKTSVNILLDLGSQRSYITSRVVAELELEPIGQEMLIINTFGSREGRPKLMKEYSFCVSNQKRGCNIYMKGFGVPFICSPLSNQAEVALTMYPVLNDIDLSLVGCERAEVDLLIGADFYWEIVGDEIRRVNEAGLTAVNSKLGWLLSGVCGDRPSRTTEVNFAAADVIQLEEKDQKLDGMMERFFGLDVLGIQDNETSVYENFLEGIEFKDSRYEVKLPFKEDMPVMEDNFNLCRKRLDNLLKKLEKDKALMAEYEKIIKSQLETGVVEPADLDADIGCVTYLPHRAVLREDKRTTKCRIVMDASVRNKGRSLNQCLYTGPCMNPMLFDVLLRFRVHSIALSADIEKAYLQISIWPPHRDYLRFLWVADVLKGNYEVVKLRYARLLFGATCSQFLLNGTTTVHAQKYAKIDPEFANQVRRHFYVDDFNSGVKSYEDGVELYKKMKIRFLEGNFNLQKWRTNSEELRKFIDLQEKGGDEVGNSEMLFNDKILGIPWDEQGDSLILDMKSFFKDANVENPTKRGILRVMAGIYDPLGFLEPYTIRIKLLFQDLWGAKVAWDEALNEDYSKKWLAIVSDIRKTNMIVLPRCYCKAESAQPIQKVELHSFSDASEKAYGACVYLRFIRDGEVPNVTLVASKSRLAPLKNKQTIPRLELLGNLLAANLVGNVHGALKEELDINSTYYWTDSQVSLAWIRAANSEFKTFVQNRVLQIRRKTELESWNFCSSENNVADIVTRSYLWLKGPGFLREKEFKVSRFIDENNSMKPPEHSGVDINMLEKQSISDTSLAVTTSNYESISVIIDITKYNNLIKLLRVTSWVLRFISNCKRKLVKQSMCLFKYLVSDELDQAKKCWIKDNQIMLRSEAGYQELVKQLNLRESDDGLLRSFSRLIKANIPFDTKAPIMLSKKHKLTEILVYYFHEKVMHQGIKHTLTEFRSIFWITQGRSYVKKIIAPCVICRRLNSRPYEYPGHSDIPSFRFNDTYAYTTIGLDFAGPIYCLPVYGGGKDMRKSWMVIFTCASTRALSLELVHDASADAFLLSFERFISRRGCPAMVISDNGKVFKAERTQNFASERSIEWKFIIDNAPWMGGMYERLIGTVKRCLKKVIGTKRKTFIELQTLLCTVELILNNRPIGCDYEDNQEDVLSPNHLIYGRRLEITNGFDRVELDDGNQFEFAGRRSLETMLAHFWKRWRKEYVTSLREQQRTLFKGHSRKIQTGDVVIVFDEKCPRHLWRTGKVEKLLESSDGEVRAAEVKLGRTNMLIKRPVNKLYPLLPAQAENLLVPRSDLPPVTMDSQDNTKPAQRKVRNNSRYSSGVGERTPDKITDGDTSKLSAQRNMRPKRIAAARGEMQRRQQIM